MGLIALLVDYLFTVNELKVMVRTDAKAAYLKGKNKLFDLLLPENVELIGEEPQPDPSSSGERY
jgi:hypothetical protein